MAGTWRKSKLKPEYWALPSATLRGFEPCSVHIEAAAPLASGDCATIAPGSLCDAACHAAAAIAPPRPPHCHTKDESFGRGDGALLADSNQDGVAERARYVMGAG
jgi:hypothetical protein